MADIRLSMNGAELVVVVDGAPAWPIHPLWLRERCRDAESMDGVTQQRLYNPSDLDPALAISSVLEMIPGTFSVTFSDGSSCDFTQARILAEFRNSGVSGDPEPDAWTNSDAAPVPVKWSDCGDGRVRLRVLRDFLVHGYIIFQGVPSHSGAVLDVARHFGFPRETNFGVMFDVRSVPHANDLAYTPLPLDPHTDNPYRAPVPGIQLLHCLVNQTTGGLSTLVDGLAVAEALRASNLEAFESLSRIAVRFRYVDAGTELEATVPLIELDFNGQFAAIHYSPRLDFVPLLPPHKLASFYAARRLLDDMLKSAVFERRFRLQDGDLMMFDNCRLLHGRTGFDPQSGLRHLQGCYIDADGPRSEFRVLRRRLS